MTMLDNFPRGTICIEDLEFSLPCAVGDTVVLKGEALVLAPSRKFD